MVNALRKIRRDLHRIPEAGLQEYKTARYIREKLTEWGVAYENWLETAVVAVFGERGERETVAFRADIDGLPVTETPKEYASAHLGWMHACGHDGHAAMLLGLAQYLSEHPACYQDRQIILIFQPAEEGPGGAGLLMEAGLLEKFQVKKIIGCHIFPQVEQGKVACRKGAMMARNGEVDIIIRGKSAHGAQPQLGSDAVLAAGAVITAIHTILSRNVSPLDSGVLTFGTIHGGEACNIIAGEVKLEGTMRAFSDAAYETMERRVHEVVQGVAAGYGCTGEAVFRHMYRVVDNDGALVQALEEVCGECYEETPPYMLAEDFSLYQTAIPGMFFFLGSGAEGKNAPLHSADFDFNEEILVTGVETYVKLLEKI
ncbi:MAG: amidohydrolase [Bacillota bacterium]|nr:amidohydrolase [Bacillota bacterium]